MDIQQKIGYDFIGNRKITFVISLVIIVLGVGSILINGGLNFGIEFVGGTLVEVRFTEIPEVNDVRDAIDDAGFKEAVIQRLGNGEVVMIRVQQESESASAVGEDEGGQITKALEAVFGANSFVINRVWQVGPQVGSELRRSAQLALLFAIVGLVLYISWRFESKFALPVAIIAVITIGLSSWNVAISLIIMLALIAVSVACIVFDYHFAFAAIIALIHDVTITVGVFSLTDREITLPVVAALLAIIGYSLNDTIVIFDRIRENIRLMGRKLPEQVLNVSIRQTLSRTILTSLTTLIVVLVLLFAGGHVINSFAFALFIGVLTGTYSSIFIATPLLFEWNNRSKGGIFRKV
ncbi:protein translocase subunit SecF [candidate division KSB3 bacterium]|uniref:Protein-export membrane protein SecF n=1 Tax=candidate division KSB3 bacterium TaxID=2044937 RepID=A0A2G6E7K1_9BACT|nr:MAG: protein translocase subunit SecF [candidate division KSB3 bacterium]PIE30155.1 MAG: protein translocase subunit SecF [candidate division KSB3 bacterium]